MLRAEDFAFRGWLDTRAISFPGEPDRTSDMVAHLANLLEHGIPWALLLEFQIVPDSEMFGRIVRHLAALWSYVKPDVEPNRILANEPITPRSLCSSRNGRDGKLSGTTN
ncbi:MAG TPA: hypothetical protein VG122_09425 [Gemmata sp.]|nr:hypothetical protein [Gemmata sp.]